MRAANFNMKMRTGCFARHTHKRNLLTLRDNVTLGYENFRRVGVKRLRTVFMRDNDIISLATIPRAVVLRDNDCARGRRVNRRTFWRREVNGIISVKSL